MTGSGGFGGDNDIFGSGTGGLDLSNFDFSSLTGGGGDGSGANGGVDFSSFLSNLGSAANGTDGDGNKDNASG